MKQFFMILWLLLVTTTVAAQTQERTPPKYRGADIQYYMSRLVGEAMKIAESEEVEAGTLSPEVILRGEVDTLGVLGSLQWIDQTTEGPDRRDLTPATPATRELLAKAVGQVGALEPAQRDGKPVPYRLTMTLRIPIQKLAAKQETDPLLFLGKDPKESFHEWARVRTRNTSVTPDVSQKNSPEGLVHVRFYIEPDGRITIGEVVKAPNAKRANDVVRVIKSSKGKWTPRKVRGVPQRTAYDYRVNYSML